MHVDIPFTVNPDGWHCIHAAMQGVIKHFTNDYVSMDFLNALMNPDHEMWVWPFQAVKSMDELGLFVRLFSTYNLGSFQSAESIKESFPGRYCDLTCINSVRESIAYIQLNNLFENKNLSLSEIEGFIARGCVPIVMMGCREKLGKYVILTGYDSDNLYYHDSGPEGAEPHKRVSKKDFINCWRETPSNNVAIIVYGKKYKDTYTRFHF